MPHELPFGMSVARLGLRPAASFPMQMMQGMMPGAPPPPPAAAPMAAYFPQALGGRAAPRMLAKQEASDRGAADDRPAMVRDEPAALSEASRGYDEEAADEVAAPEPIPARPSPARPEAKEKGILRRLGEKMRQFVRGPEDGSVVVAGRVVLADDSRVTLEIEAWDDLDWQPSDLLLGMVDGTTLPVTLVSERSTRPGPVAAGRRLRITVTWSGERPAAELAQLTLKCGERKVTVQL
jgi:hypothetical protein